MEDKIHLKSDLESMASGQAGRGKKVVDRQRIGSYIEYMYDASWNHGLAPDARTLGRG